MPSCKTARHGKSERIIPIFQELETPLRDCFEQAEPGAVYLIERHCPAKMRKSKDRKDGNREANLMTMFDKIVLRAGLIPWPMPGNNLRGSLVTDLYNGKYPEIGIHTIAAWIGHSPEIAMKHYTRIRDEDFDKVRSKSTQPQAKKTVENALSSYFAKDKHQNIIAHSVSAINNVTLCERTQSLQKSIAHNHAQYTPETDCTKLPPAEAGGLVKGS